MVLQAPITVSVGNQWFRNNSDQPKVLTNEWDNKKEAVQYVQHVVGLTFKMYQWKLRLEGTSKDSLVRASNDL
jgi:hypothetical protein